MVLLSRSHPKNVSLRWLIPAGLSGPVKWVLLTCSYSQRPFSDYFLSGKVTSIVSAYLFVSAKWTFHFQFWLGVRKEVSWLFPLKNLGLHSMVDDRRQLSKDLTHFKLVKLMLLCESFSLPCLLCSFTRADSVVCSEQAIVKGYINIITILLPRTLSGPRVYVFFPHSKPFLKPSRLLCEQNQVLKILK